MSVLYGEIDEAKPEAHESKGGHGRVIKIITVVLLLWTGLPVLGVGVYRTTSGDLHFDLWYLMVYMVIGFFLMHELITPMPSKDGASHH